MDRRAFVKSSLVLSSGMVIADSLLGCVNPSIAQAPLEDIHKEFQDPPVEARLFVRWWWNGNRLDKQEILRELDVMKEAGIGGVEINPIAFPPHSDPVGYEALTIYEDDWLDMLQVALEGAKARGMICDMIVGSGWPFGGEFLKKEDQTQMVTIETLQLEGNRSHTFTVEELLSRVDPEIHSKHPEVYRDLLMIRLMPQESTEFTAGEDLLGLVSKGRLSLEVPEGRWVLYYVVKLTGYMAVINGSPGAAGPVLNHYSKSATETYLNTLSDHLTAKVGKLGTLIRAMFCDSMELEGANWNDDLPQEFESRRGYALLPYLPFVLKKVGHMGNPLDEAYGTRFSEEVSQLLKRVELDFYLTRIELFKERFIDTFNSWCHKHKLQSRMQAYGRGMHPLEASMEIDIPDCETWLFKDVGRIYPKLGLQGRAPRMCNKYVASAASLAGKKLVACEEITNTSMAFMASLENIKVAGDQSNLSGVNHSILHGYNYSPPEAPFPGWVRYGSYFSERNTWWPYFRKWSDYKARISHLLQQASPRAEVAILQPLTDLWLKYGPQRDPFPGKWYPEYQNNLWEVIHQNGGGCDYVSEAVICASTFHKGRMTYKQRSYHTLLLPEIETLDLATAHALVDFADAGGRIVFIGDKPFKSASYQEMAVNDALVQSLMDKLIHEGREKVHLVSTPEGSLLEWYGKLQEKLGIGSYIKFDRAHRFLNQASYLLGEHPMFFLANSSLYEDLMLEAEFDVDQGLTPWIWDPETGGKFRYPTGAARNRLQISLPRASSVMLIFMQESEGEEHQAMLTAEGGEEVRGPWILDLEPISGGPRQLELDELADLATLEQTRHFCGTVTYRKTLATAGEQPDLVDLGSVQGISELTVNGYQLGTRWYGAHLYDVSEVWKKGKNELVIRLTTIVGNYMKGLKDNQVAQRWVGHQEYYSMGLLGPVRLCEAKNINKFQKQNV